MGSVGGPLPLVFGCNRPRRLWSDGNHRTDDSRRRRTGRTRAWSRPALAVVAVLALVGLGIRIWIMTSRLGAIDSDEAITGLMARHLLDGEFRAFMWRLSYQGTIATYPVALSFKLLGTSRFALELPYVLMSAGAAVCVWRIATRFLRPFQAVFAGLGVLAVAGTGGVDRHQAVALLRADAAPRRRRDAVRGARWWSVRAAGPTGAPRA